MPEKPLWLSVLLASIHAIDMFGSFFFHLCPHMCRLAFWSCALRHFLCATFCCLVGKARRLINLRWHMKLWLHFDGSCIYRCERTHRENVAFNFSACSAVALYDNTKWLFRSDPLQSIKCRQIKLSNQAKDEVWCIIFCSQQLKTFSMLCLVAFYDMLGI